MCRVMLLLLVAPLLMAGMKPQVSMQGGQPYPAGKVVYHASQSGYPTLDSDQLGGNPFASAFVELMKKKGVGYKSFRQKMKQLTLRNSDSFQHVEISSDLGMPDWIITSPAVGEKRIALVIVISDYSAAKSITSLPGARLDAKRVSDALQEAGYETKVALDQSLANFRAEIEDFKRRSSKADVAIIYTTGHGGEFDGEVYLISGDYPLAKGKAALSTHAHKLRMIATGANAKRVNLIFYAGCRDQPF